MPSTEHSKVDTVSYTLADAQTLNTIKNRLRDVTKLLDTSSKTYPNSLEAHQVKHEVVVLLTELQGHGLLPEMVLIAASHTSTCGEREEGA